MNTHQQIAQPHVGPLSVLRTKYKLPFDVMINLDTNERYTSVVNCINKVNERLFNHEQYLEAITELTERKVTDWSNVHMAKYVFLYLVQGLVQNYKCQKIENIELTYQTAVRKATEYLQNNDWVVSTGDKVSSAPKIDAAGNIAPPKGAKKIKAKALYKEKIEGKIIKRKEAIELLCKEVGLTPAGASTYLANFKSGLW